MKIILLILLILHIALTHSSKFKRVEKNLVKAKSLFILSDKEGDANQFSNMSNSWEFAKVEKWEGSKLNIGAKIIQQFFIFGNNNLESVTFTKLINQSELEIGISANSKLNEISFIDKSSFKLLSIESNTSLKNLSFNKIKVYKLVIEYNKELETLDLTNVEITDKSEINLSTNKNLKKVICGKDKKIIRVSKDSKVESDCEKK